MALYRAIMACLAPVLLGLTLVQRWGGRVARGALAERLGFVPKSTGPTIWLHGASNGEVTSARWVIERLQARCPELRVAVTANTGTAVAMVRGWNMPGVTASLAPLDTLGAPARALRRWRPALLIVVENELWPARLAAARAAGVPVALIGARLSENSAANWARFAPGLMRQGLKALAFVSAQDRGSAGRLRQLGVSASVLGPDLMLKAQVPLSVPSGATQPVQRARVLLAASTHPGEEAIVLAAFRAARAQFDLLILAPRHPRRSSDVAALVTAAGLPCAIRSAGASPSAMMPVFLADTMGEMAAWYAMAGVTVIGGSFVPMGGHTPFEPAALDSAIVHGPFMNNFAEAVDALAREGGAVSVDVRALAGALASLDAACQLRLCAAARRALIPGGGDDVMLDRLLSLAQGPLGP